MENRINVAELLKDCPKGMELDCTLFSNVTFNYVTNNGIWIKYFDSKGHENEIYLDCEGCLPLPALNSVTDKCVIFPKGKTTWEGFQIPFKDGDIAISESGDWIGIVNSLFSGNDCYKVYVVFENFGKCSIIHKDAQTTLSRLATEKEKQKLFDAIKANGYEWNAETKTLEKLIEPKFHKGDWIVFNGLTLYVKEVVKDIYRTISKGDGINNSYDWCIDKVARLWTIQDAKDGDVLYRNANDDGDNDDRFKYVFILKEVIEDRVIAHCFINGERFVPQNTFLVENSYPIRFATEEEKEKLFQAIKDNGYEWNAETKTLKKLVEPKFHEGDWVVDNQSLVHQIERVVENVTTHTFGYDIVGGGYFNDSTEGVRLWTIQDAKDGDVLCTYECDEPKIVFILKGTPKKHYALSYHCYYNIMYPYFASDSEKGCLAPNDENVKPATKEQRDFLFKEIRDAGYKWNAKTLEKLIEPKFKVGDRIGHKTADDDNIYEISKVYDDSYGLVDFTCKLDMKYQGNYELVPNKFDIRNLKEFDKVLVRDCDKDKWNIDFFSYYRDSGDYQCMTFVKNQCIPYEGNEHLLGKTDNCNEYYKTWK